MGFFRRGTPMDPAHLAELQRELQAMKESLEHHQRSTSALTERFSTPTDGAPPPDQGLDALVARVDEVQAKHAELDAKVTAAGDAPAHAPELDALVARVEEVQAKHAELDAKVTAAGDAPAHAPELDALVARVEEVQAKHAELEGKLGELTARISSVSTELANQITELGHDIDALGEADAGAGAGIDEASIGALRDGQVRLANEQARYQIAFRDDLAKLAEHLRRPTN